MTPEGGKAVTAATFSDFKLIRGRKCAQLVLEIPIEQADRALKALGGLPNPAEERWCAIALLAVTPQPALPEEPKQIEAPKKEFPLSSKVAMTCQEKSFKEFLCSWAGLDSGADPAEYVRDFCGVMSRSDILPGTQAEKSWNMLRTEYENWQRGFR